MKKLYTIGGATQDIFIQYKDAEMMTYHKGHESHTYMMLEQGLKLDIADLYHAVGGGAANTASAFAQLGFEVEALFARGDDPVGRFIVEHLTKKGIGLSHHIVKKGFQSAVSFIIPSTEKNNVALCYRGVARHLTEDVLSESLFLNASCVYIASLPGESGKILPSLAKKAQAHKAVVASNPGMSQIVESKELLEALSSLDILILNKIESVHLMKRFVKDSRGKSSIGSSSEGRAPSLFNYFSSIEGSEISLYDYFSEVFSRGPSVAVITNGSEGVYIGTKETIYFHPSIEVAAVSSLGAGDAFGSTFVGALLLGKTIEEAIVYGVLNASSVIERLDAQSGLLDFIELQKRAMRLGTRQLQVFPFF